MPGRGVREPPIRAGDRLEQRVLSQRLVEVHRLLDGRIEAGKQFCRDDQECQRVVGVVEPCLDVGFLRPVQGVLDPGAGLLLAGADGHDDRRLVRQAALGDEA